MEKMLEHIFYTEIERQCTFALIAASELENYLSRADMDRIWYSLQNVLVAVGNVSKVLWPSDSERAARGRALPEVLKVSEESAIGPRKFRNHFEHFDERLEEWARSSERKNFVDLNVGPTRMIVGIEPGDFLRNFDTVNWAVTFRGDAYHLRPVIDEIRDLWERAATEARRWP